MAYLFGRFSLSGFCFINSLCWNVCWLADSKMPDSWHFCNQISGLWLPWVSFGMLGTSKLPKCRQFRVPLSCCAPSKWQKCSYLLFSQPVLHPRSYQSVVSLVFAFRFAYFFVNLDVFANNSRQKLAHRVNHLSFCLMNSIWFGTY